MSLASPADAEFIEFQDAVAGRYSLEREIGRGGMGIVYLAREVRLARPVAIKVLPRALAAARPELRERFVREAQMAARLSHPHIVPIHHVDEAGGFVFFVMTYIDGQTLGERVRARGPLTPTDASRVLREVGWALAYAHLRGIVHRDVKPDNILLERDTGRALVTDFGIAGAVETVSSAPSEYVRGTVHFLSPEQAAGEPLDGRSDIYSLGIVGYFMLTGRLPFDGPNAMAVMTAQLRSTPAPISRLSPAVPPMLARAVERCLEKAPERRWATGEEFASAVDLAFEQPKEIPTPLRVWLARGDREGRVQAIVSIYLLGPIVPLAMSGHPIATLVPVAAVFLAVTVPTFLRARQVRRAGYSLEDLRAALRTHTQLRREERAYELSVSGALTAQTLWKVAGGSAVVAGALAPVAMAALKPNPAPVALAAAVLFATAVFTTVLGLVGGTSRTISARTGASVFSLRSSFWNSEWGARIFRAAQIGLKRVAVAPAAMPQFTEVALGRATDLLFEALPKAQRKELKAIPATVRRLEADARALRETLEQLDGSERRDEGLQRAHAIATERLGSTVAALENIRLGLLRLQLGNAPVAQVTEALEAAARIGRDLELASAADEEVRRVLGPAPELAHTPV
jgi:serine/threonine-protein kinase